MRKSFTSLMILAGCSLLIAVPASADVVIHFVSGKTMPAKAVRYVDDMVQVDLGGDGLISFPRASIEKVEVPERALNLERNTALSRQQSRPMVAGSTERAGERSGGSSSGVQETELPRRRNPGVSAQSRQQVDKYGLAVTNAVPMARGSAATTLKNVVQPDPQAARNNNVAGGGSIRGTHFAGGRYVMASDELPPRPRAVPITLNSDAPPPPPPPPPEPPPSDE